MNYHHVRIEKTLALNVWCGNDESSLYFENMGENKAFYMNDRFIPLHTRKTSKTATDSVLKNINWAHFILQSKFFRVGNVKVIVRIKASLCMTKAY